MKKILFISMLCIVVSCNLGVDGDQTALSAAEQWAEAYFNDDFQEAGKYATPESERWLRFAASNATEEDLQLLNANKATTEADEHFSTANDTLRVVTLHVKNYLSYTSLGSKAVQVKEGVCHVNVVKTKDGWRVKMEGLPQSGMQSHD